MTDQATAQTTAQQPSQPAPAKHDTLAVLAFIFGILLWPLAYTWATPRARRPSWPAASAQPWHWPG